MGDIRDSSERLPWLEPLPAKPPMPAAARRARTPLFVLFALLASGVIAVMAFLAGRTSAPVEPRQVAPAPLTVRLPAATPAPVPVIVPPAPAASPGPRSTARATPVRKRTARRNPRFDRRGMVPPIERAFPLAPIGSATPREDTAPPPTSVMRPPPAIRLPTVTPQPAARALSVSSARPVTRARTPSRGGATVQLGAYVTLPQLESAWVRLVAAYPTLRTRPRMVTGTSLPGRPHYYRLRVAAGSRREARALCDHLHRIGRGCMVVATAK